MNKIGNLVYKVGDNLAKFIYLHLIWLLFTIVGLVIFGIMPATAAMFSILRKWLRGEEIPIFKTFLRLYKSYFIKQNILGFIYMLAGLFLYVDFVVSYTKIQWLPLHVLIWIVCVFYIIVLAFSMPVFVNYELNIKDYLKQTLLIVLSSPLETLLIIVSILLLYYVFLLVPVLFIFSGSTIVALPLMWIALRAFKKIEEKARVNLN